MQQPGLIKRLGFETRIKVCRQPRKGIYPGQVVDGIELVHEELALRLARADALKARLAGRT